MYGEDVDLPWRARALGFPVLIAPHALFTHAVTNRADQPALRRAMLASTDPAPADARAGLANLGFAAATGR